MSFFQLCCLKKITAEKSYSPVFVPELRNKLLDIKNYDI